jgi:hypothetical protein
MVRIVFRGTKKLLRVHRDQWSPQRDMKVKLVPQQLNNRHCYRKRRSMSPPGHILGTFRVGKALDEGWHVPPYANTPPRVRTWPMCMCPCASDATSGRGSHAPSALVKHMLESQSSLGVPQAFLCDPCLVQPAFQFNLPCQHFSTKSHICSVCRIADL